MIPALVAALLAGLVVVGLLSIAAMARLRILELDASAPAPVPAPPPVLRPSAYVQRARCGWCGQQAVALDGTGRFVHHDGGLGVPCEGSGWRA